MCKTSLGRTFAVLLKAHYFRLPYSYSKPSSFEFLSHSWRMDQHKANKYGNYLDLLVFGKGFVTFELVIVNQIINEYLFQNFELFFICF